MENQPKNKPSEWLDKMSQDSWQLELLVSGFSIVLLMGALDALDALQFKLSLVAIDGKESSIILQLGFAILVLSTIIMLINLVLHVLLRGIWISAVGLRSVSGDIDFDYFKFADKFDRFLRRRTGTFDNYIHKLENLCSIVFAFTFMIVFMLLAMGMWLLFLILVIDVVFNNLLEGLLPETLADQIGDTLATLIIASGLAYLIDFITLGWLKRIKWFTRIYYPVYRFYGFLTFARLYRPIYYNLVDNPFGRKLGYLLVPYILLIMVAVNLGIESYPWFPKNTGNLELNTGNYDDLRDEDNLVSEVSLPSKYIGNGYLEVFIRYFPHDNDKLAKLCPDFTPAKKEGFKSGVHFNVAGKKALRQHEADTSLICFGKLYQVSVNDSIYNEPRFRFYEHPNRDEPGLLCILDVSKLTRGEHRLTVKKHTIKDKDNPADFEWTDFASIPFWVE
jgi:hypothetical protein